MRRRYGEHRGHLQRIGARLGVEGFAFMVSCRVGPLGGWIYILTRSQSGTPVAVSTTD